MKNTDGQFFVWIVLWGFMFVSCADGQPDVCEVWKSSPDANYSYVVKIQVQQGLYFCSGILVEQYWVLMSYSCFQRISRFAADSSRTDAQISSNNRLQKQFNETNCFDIENLRDTQILIRTVTDNCVISTVEDLDNELFTIPNFGVIFDGFQNEIIEFRDYQNNVTNTTVHLNDFLLLRLRDQFDGVPWERVTLRTFDSIREDISYEIFLQVQDQSNYFTQFVQTGVTSEFENENFACSQNFQDSVCAQNDDTQNQDTCINKRQNYICGKFNIPNISGVNFQLHSGDALARTQVSPDAEIFGFFTADFIPENDRKYYEQFSKTFYTYPPGNYSFDLNGAIFVGFTQELLNWINITIKNYNEDQCIFILEEILPHSGDDNDSTVIIISVICSILFLVIVAVAIILWRRHKYPEVGLPLVNRRPGSQSRLDPIDMMGLEEIFSDNPQGLYDSAFNGPPGWWSGIRIPEGVREIPISDLKGIQRLGAGGFAVVYQAEFEEHAKEQYGDLGKQQVAVKIVFKEYLQIKDSMDAILREVAAMNKLDSEHIVKLLGASLQIRPSIVMELVAQGSLEDLLEMDGYKCDQTSLAWKLKLMLNIVKGIQYLHSKNVFHRDLKPPNILIKDRDTAITKISDFGLAKIQQTTQANCYTKHVAGTRQYMAPEMFDKYDNIDEKVDIWALGVIMQQILRGVKPWEGQNDNYIIARISVHKEPPENGYLPKTYPQDLCSLIQSCWNQKSLRPSAEQIVQKLENVLERESPPAKINEKCSFDTNSSDTVLAFEIQKES